MDLILKFILIRGIDAWDREINEKLQIQLFSLSLS